MKYISVFQYWISQHPILCGVTVTIAIIIALMIYEADITIRTMAMDDDEIEEYIEGIDKEEI